MRLAQQSKRRGPSLTPMIDVVFLLLVFFMLAARFGLDVAINLPLTGASETPYQGPPRLVGIAPAQVRLNGRALADDVLLAELGALMLSHTDAVILQPENGADLQRVVAVMELLSDAGYETLVLVE
jgi:biopolymer transport protein ExbD